MTTPILSEVSTDDLYAWLDFEGNRYLAQKSAAFLSLYMHWSEHDPSTGLPTERALAASKAASDLRIHLSVYSLVSSRIEASERS